MEQKDVKWTWTEYNIDIAHKTINKKNPEKYLPMFTLLVAKRRADWEPILQKAKEMQNKKPQKSAKKTAWLAVSFC